MESELVQYDVRSGTIGNSDSQTIFSNPARPQLTTPSPLPSLLQVKPEFSTHNMDTTDSNTTILRPQLDTTPPPLPNPTLSASLVTDNQMMSSYISSSDPDLPNQYNIIIAGDDEEEEDMCRTLTSPVSTVVDTHPQQQISTGSAPYRSYTVQFKLDTLDWYYKNGQNKNLTAKMFQVDRKRIRDWLLDEPNLRSDPTPERTKRKRNNCLPQYKEIESALYHYYLEQREKGLRPKNAELRAKSLEFASEYGYGDAFKASVHWLCNWKRRNKIALVTINGGEDEDTMGVSNNLEDQLNRLSQSLKVQGSGEGDVDALGNTGQAISGLDGMAGGVMGGVERVKRDILEGMTVRLAKEDQMPPVHDHTNVMAERDHAYVTETDPTHIVTGPTHMPLGGVAGSRTMYTTSAVSRVTGSTHTPIGGVAGHTYITLSDPTSAVSSIAGPTHTPVGGVAGHTHSLPDPTSASRVTGSSNAPVEGVAIMEGMVSDDTLSQQMLIDPSTCEQWVELVEQTVLSLETDMAKKLKQIKLLLLQIKRSLHPPHRAPVTTPTSAGPLPHSMSPEHTSAQHNVLLAAPHTSNPHPSMATPTHHPPSSIMLSRTHPNRH